MLTTAMLSESGETITTRTAATAASQLESTTKLLLFA